MIKILVNQTNANIDLDIGLTVPASGQLTLNPQDYDEASSSDDIVTEVGAGNLVVNDGNQNLTKADGIRLVQGGFSNKIQLDDDLLLSDRVKVDVTGTLSDGRIKVSSNDGISGFLEDKITVGSNKLTKVTNNEGSDETVQIDIDSQEINTADLNNDAGFITSGQAPVQPSDISNFETSTELDARDVDNRNRTNHTGTQLASTISDFNAAVAIAETTTTLSFNSVSNILSYVNEDNQTTNVDLTQYLDDTNLARIINGILDANTGIITFNRDDNTTFTVDASALLDNQDASEVPFSPTGNTTSNDVQSAIVELQIEIDDNTLKVSADGSIDTHSDVDVTTVTPVLDDVLAWDGVSFIPKAVSTSNGFTIFPVWAEENGGLSDNNRQWSFGNGSTGACDIVIPIDCELFAFSTSTEVATGTCNYEIFKNGTVFITTDQLSQHDFQSFPTPFSFTAGERLGFRTDDEQGTFTDTRICAWFRVRASQASTSVLSDLLDVSLTTIQNGQALVYNGSNWVNQTIFDGDYNNLTNRPTLGTAADNDETDFATAAQGTLASSAIQPNDNVSDLSNDAGYVNAAQASAAAPVQPVDIANFETTTELNTRDADNRNRSNHTGTQLASTISDFSTAVALAETTTSLSFNNSNNILTFVDEDNATTNIDLSLYLDDTNLARITSGTLDSGSGIATFTRDDSSTFTLDLSSLNDQAFINAAIDTHEQTISNHDDVDTVTVTPNSGDLLRYDGTNWTPYNDFKIFTKLATPLGTQLTTFQNALSLGFNIPVSGNYEISWFYEWSLNTTNSDFLGRVQVDNITDLMTHRQEPQDSAGTGTIVDAIEGGTFNSGTDQTQEVSGTDVINLTAGTHVLDLDISNSVANTEATIYRATLIVKRF